MLVTAIEESPEIAVGEGSVVTARFLTREVHEIARVEILGPDGQRDRIEGTSIHPIWSEDRQDWIPLGELRSGEILRAAIGDAVVQTVELLSQAVPVYNIEVHGEHVYEVKHLGVMVHNSYAPNSAIDFSTAASRIPGQPWKNLGQLRSYLDRNGIGLQTNGGWYLDRWGANKMAGFDWSRSRPVIFTRPGATKAEILHEIGHALTFKRLGQGPYEALSPKIREHLASAFATGRPGFTKNMTMRQLLHEWKAIDENFVPSAELLEKLKGLGIF